MAHNYGLLSMISELCTTLGYSIVGVVASCFALLDVPGRVHNQGSWVDSGLLIVLAGGAAWETQDSGCSCRVV